VKDLSKITDSIYFKIAIVVVILAVIFAIYKGIQALINKRDAYSREAMQNFSNNNLTYENLEYENMSNRLFDAMDRWNTDEDTIYSTLRRLKTSDDWYKLVHVFGVKKSNSMWDSFSGNLSEWLVYVLDGSEQEDVSSILSSINVNF